MVKEYKCYTLVISDIVVLYPSYAVLAPVTNVTLFTLLMLLGILIVNEILPLVTSTVVLLLMDTGKIIAFFPLMQ